MKYPTLQKIGLTTIALLASLALSAQGGTKAKVSSTRQTLGQTGQKNVSMTAKSAGRSGPSSTYQYDDGTSEQGVGFGNGAQNFESIWFNQFAVSPGNETITSVDVVWGSPLFPGFAPNGTPVTIGVWSDPNGDGNPSDAVLLGSVAGTVQNSDTDTPVTYTFSPAVTLPAGATSFFVGDMTPMNNGPELFWQGQDTSDSAPNKSWVAADSLGGPVDFNNLGNNDFLFTIDSQGLPGNWLIRADSGNGTPTPTPTPTVTPTPPPGALWYNGDFPGEATGNGLANEAETSLGSGQFAFVYDDFNVPDSGGWDIDSVFSNNLEDTNVTAAVFEIRSGVSSGNGGTIIASGTTVTPVVTPTGRSGFGFTEFMIEITGLSIHLDAGTYHLSVWPVGDLTGRSFNSTTAGANCIGTPCGDDANAFWTSNFFGVDFIPTTDPSVGCLPPNECIDFSMGVNGVVSGGGGEITLSATVRRVHGNRLVALSWTPADGGDINVLRDGVIIRTKDDNGRAQDPRGTGPREVHVYQVCETDTGTCSNEVKVKVPGSGGP
jgi:hypothetical protein